MDSYLVYGMSLLGFFMGAAFGVTQGAPDGASFSRMMNHYLLWLGLCIATARGNITRFEASTIFWIFDPYLPWSDVNMKIHWKGLTNPFYWQAAADMSMDSLRKCLGEQAHRLPELRAQIEAEAVVLAPALFQCRLDMLSSPEMST
ncbi:MAG: hypothetical protein MUF64_32800 [Polyangiaceae bacterium]|jgi:hypothetical protein|nr:hypothetical protein [Polyangiaceae bacterium]